jgi:hypothetical protein
MKTPLNIVFLIIIGLFIQYGHAQNVTVAGSNIKLSNGTLMNIPGDLTFIADVEVENAGSISVGGNWKNNSTGDLFLQNGSGTVILNGTSGQIIGGNSRTYFGNLVVEQFVELENEIHVAGVLHLNNAKIALNKYNLFMEPDGQISGAGENAYLIAHSQGVLVREVGNAEVLFPVGTSTLYLPATLTNTGLIDNYAINVFPDILEFGTSGNTIPEIDHCVLNTWHIIEQSPRGSNLTIKFQWNAENERVLFDRTKSGIGHFQDDSWNAPNAKPASGSNPYTQTRTGLTTVGAFAVGDENSPMAIHILYDEHNILLPEGWSGLSSYINPLSSTLEDVFVPISNELIIAQTMTGMYFPGQNINTIGNWESQSAYKVKTSAGCTLTLTGDYETNMTVLLKAGWNLLPVVTPDGAPAADLLSPVNGFVIAKDVAGTGIYWPEFGINTMEYLLPGKAYFVLLTENAEVNYADFKSNFTGSKNLSASIDLTAFNIQATPSTHTIAIFSSAIETFDPGTFIGAYDQAGNCFGITKIGEGNNSITIFGDDPTTGEKDGFFEGEMVFFKTLTGFENLVGLEPTFDQNLPQSDGLFTENGLSAITSFKASTGILGNNLLSSVKVFPNPSDGLVNISGIIPGTVLTVTDLQGKVLMEKIADSENTEFDLTDYQSGVYFIKISQNGTNIFRKIVLK